ncbi:MAG: AAA family ATPase [Roseburia sp.]
MEEKRKLPGVTREEEEKQLEYVIKVAEENLEKTIREEKRLAEDIHELVESYGAKDVEALSMLHNTQVMYEETKKNLERCEKARRKPYFGRIDLYDKGIKQDEVFYIGKVGIARNITEPEVIDWRAPIASVYYENALGDCSYTVKKEGTYQIQLNRKRTYEIEEDQLKDFYDSDVVANDELLTKYLAKNKKAVLGEIIATIQKEQNAIIRKSPRQNVIVQGAAGSGKTTVAMHRISYILYNYEEDFRPEDFYIVGSNQILLNYITSVLPDLDVYGVRQMTMEQLLTRLLYEDWDENTMKVRLVERNQEKDNVKGTFSWYQDLEEYCKKLESQTILAQDIFFEGIEKKKEEILLTAESIQKYLEDNPDISIQNKIQYLNKRIMAKVQNVLSGKNITYGEEEKKEIRKKYRNYFGNREWKTPIYEMYLDFLNEQKEKGYIATYSETEFDIYDLAALAYLYKRVKETELIREASHVVIDEAQDFGMMVYAVLKYCMRGCTFTIMGDVSQNIHFGYGLNDWEELKKHMLTGNYDSFQVLKKSYRNTIEISNFAMRILKHGNFPIYPVEPIIRHGKEVLMQQYTEEQVLFEAVTDKIKNWQEEGLETIAVICRTEERAKAVANVLGKKVKLLEEDVEKAEFGSGVMVLPIEYTKGLEFDAVLILDPNQKDYPLDDGHVKLLYVAATRALHELAVFHLGNLTRVIADPVLKKEQQVFKEEIKVEKIPKRKERKDSNQKDVSREIGISRKIDVPKESKILKNDKVELEFLKPQVFSSGKKAQHQFGDIPSNDVLRPAGHGRIDTRIRWIQKHQNGIELVSSYGMLYVSPITEDMIRVTFGVEDKRKEIKMSSDTKTRWECKESREKVLVQTKNIIVSIEKTTGAISFYNRNQKLLLAERSREPRQIERGKQCRNWNYFEWQRSERITAKGILKEERLSLKNTAKYICYGEKSKKYPCVLSSQGYGIIIPADSTVMCCNIPMYGPYLYTEEMEVIDYFFVNGKNEEEILNQYSKLLN